MSDAAARYGVRAMARGLRAVEGGGYYHVLNRGNGRRRIFAHDGDYDAFCRVLAEAAGRYPVGVLAYCLMPKHWHLLVRPAGDGDLPAFMRWLMVTHVRRHHAAHGTRGGGHVYQGRYRSFPVQGDAHFLAVARYVEANAARARLAADPAGWPWGSLAARRATAASRRAAADPSGRFAVPLADWPVDRPRRWRAAVAARARPADLAALRTCVARHRPFGTPDWVRATAARLGLEQAIRPVGRPRRSPAAEKADGNQ